nr:MAG TPA: zinc-ribbon protein [Caudoviricetes sp.]
MTPHPITGDPMYLRCKTCSKLLAIGSGNLQIKCSRCKTINIFNNSECREHRCCNPQHGCPDAPR